MSESTLTKKELAALVLAEIRNHGGCEGVHDVVIVETKNPRSVSNWEICIIAADSGDPSTVQRAGAEVQQRLQPLYRLP
ncbi:hypothetical protein [Bradyrhizobium sp.]|uniref:hypothetical protein n=1 Tax=Bradyrhizobium sp. TaxID=376 RepID=UPI003C70DA3C